LSPTGAKEREWDFRTPEGTYIIDFRQEHSHYYKALHISYPSAADVKRSTAQHAPAGRDIFIHGEPNQPTKPVSYYRTRDWTNGCIALSDDDLQEVRPASRSFRKGCVDRPSRNFPCRLRSDCNAGCILLVAKLDSY
jgi:murein L,D-transpeptidase YafK